MDCLPLFSDDYLFSHWENDFTAYRESGQDAELRLRLERWAGRDTSLTETQLEAQFVGLFFKKIWMYWGTGERDPGEGFCLNSQYGVAGAGQTGGKGAADLALGWWRIDDAMPSIPQVLAEFKDIRSSLDAPQRRKGNTRSPVKQCLDYLKYAFDEISLHSPVSPEWGIVTDMNEFRLYSRREGDEFCQRFVIDSRDSRESTLLRDGDEGMRRRFLFHTLFRPDQLITRHGKSRLAVLLDGQIARERELEKGFYREYQEYRQFVFEALVDANPQFSGTRGQLVKLTQRFLDRCIFILFCEDMGRALDFPPSLLCDILRNESLAATYSEDFCNIWELVKQLFSTMRDGGPFPPDHRINRFNGGLFADLPELRCLNIPNRVFCAKNQGVSPESIDRHKQTLLYLSARYNYGVHGTARERTITLYALGRIFEQSITDLEYMEAKAEGRLSLAALAKRKRDGVYYTPEWVTGYIVQETLGAKLSEIRSRLGLELGEELLPDAVAAFRKNKKAKKAEGIRERLNRLDAYERAMMGLRVLDPSCGSGAFLIQSLRCLLRERQTIAEERKRITGDGDLFDTDAAMRAILSDNLYGVDINPESVEITQLALWLHTALPGRPLSNLDHHIRCGNSLVGPEFEAFYHKKHPKTLFSDLGEQERENVNIFDWKNAFPTVLGDDVPEEQRGFDCIVGNPPYVKLQHFRKLKPDESNFFIEGRDASGTPLYESALTGSFDLYLLFIEKGISLLNAGGRMGFIAPSLWLKNEYGQGLRNKVKEMQVLERWIDFKSFQVFEEATTYTALQFFSRRRNEIIQFFTVQDRNIDPLNWREAETIEYGELPDDTAWNLLTRQEAAFIRRLQEECETLKQASQAITVGIQTSKDEIYHLRRVKSGRYMQIGSKGDGKEYEIEDAVMHPLVSGAEAKRYQLPVTETYLLFPYLADTNGMRLFSESEMETQFPKAWKYLRCFEQILRNREFRAFDDAKWYRFGRNQNIDKQEFSKLLVPRLVSHLFCIADEAGAYYLDNVDVGGVIPVNKNDLWFLCGILNAPVCNFIFRNTSKPFRGGYLSANKQYIAPLPVPRASASEKKIVGGYAKSLQKLHTERRDKITLLKRRLAASQCADDSRKPEWLWADVSTAAALKKLSPENLSPREKTAWAKREYEDRLAARFQAVANALFAGASLSVANADGEIQLLVDSNPILSVYPDTQDASFIEAQWRQAAREIVITEKSQAKKLIDAFLSLRKTNQAALKEQIIKIDAEIQSLDQKITVTESELNTIIFQLYGLNPEEKRLITSK